MSDIGQAYVQIVPSAEGISGKIQGVLAPEATSAGESAGGLLGEGIISSATMAIAAGAAAVAAVVAETVKIAAETAKYGDEIDKQSQKLGLSSKAYQEWDFILSHAGTSIGNMTVGLKTLTNKVDDAKSGSEEAIAMFDKLGISVEDLSKMSREDVFSAVVTGMQGMADSTERAALANDLFGKSGQELTPLFNTSVEETSRMREAVHELGGVMSDEAVKDSARYADSLLDMKAAFEGIKRSIGSAVIPYLASAMESVAQFIGSWEGISLIKDNLSKVGEGIMSVVEPAVQSLSDAWDDLNEALQPVKDALAEVYDNFTKANGQFSVGQAIGSALAGVFGVLAGSIRLVATVITGIVSAIQSVVAGFQSLMQSARSTWNTIKTTVQSAVASIKSTWNTLKQSLVQPIETAKAKISSVINSIKAKFEAMRSMKWLKAPHISVSGGSVPFGIGGKGTKPNISISWYRKAMDSAMILDNPTLFGMAGGNLLGGGEAGREVIAGESHLLDMINKSVDDALGKRVDAIIKLLATYLPASGDVYLDRDKVGERISGTVSKYQRANDKTMRRLAGESL